MPPTPTGPQRDRALDRLKVLAPAQAIRDPELNQALAPFRGHPPTALVCGNPRCTQPFLWCALDPLTARVRFGALAPPATQQGDEPVPASRRAPPPFDAWDPGPEVGESVVPPGEPLLRWRFRCPRCDRPCVLTNARMILLILRALASGRTSIRPAAE
jgi:hypothetical protein